MTFRWLRCNACRAEYECVARPMRCENCDSRVLNFISDADGELPQTDDIISLHLKHKNELLRQRAILPGGK